MAELKPMATQLKQQQAKLDAMYDIIAAMAEQQRNSESQSQGDDKTDWKQTGTPSASTDHALVTR